MILVKKLEHFFLKEKYEVFSAFTKFKALVEKGKLPQYKKCME